jgi:hypothetical protein
MAKPEPTYGVFGVCFEQSGTLNGYERLATCTHKYMCVLKPCSNFKVCGTKVPVPLIDAWHGRCLDCDMNLGYNLIIRDPKPDERCYPCASLKATSFVRFQKCTHEVCAECFLNLKDKTCFMCSIIAKRTMYKAKKERVTLN